MDTDTPFDRLLRRKRRDRAAACGGSADYLHKIAADELLDRLGSVKREFSDVLDLGSAGGILTSRLKKAGYKVTCADPGFAFARASGGIQCDEDRLPFASGSFDLIMSVGVLDTVNDLPGALTLARRILRPDGLFLAAFLGAGSLPRLRAAMSAADTASGAAAPRIHPQIDVRAAGDLLGRAGFALPVADCQSVSVRFPNLIRLIDDLRSMAATNTLGARTRRPILRTGLSAAMSAFAAEAEEDGKVTESFEIIYLAGWSPSPSQPQPAARGSASHSLASALRPSKSD